MANMIQSFIDLGKANPEILLALMSVLISMVLTTYIKKYVPIDNCRERRNVNGICGLLINFIVATVIYPGPHKWLVVTACAMFGPLLYVIVVAIVEKRAAVKGGAWLAVFKWLKPHRVNPNNTKKHKMYSEGCIIVEHKEDSVAIKPGKKK